MTGATAEPTEPESEPTVPVTPRTRVRQLADKAVTDRAALYAILDAGLVAHVAVHDEAGQPYVIPVAYGRDGGRLLFHGSSGSRLFRTLATGAPTCLTVTLLDGVVLARSAFEMSMHYRSVVVLGTCVPLDGEAKLAALERVSEHIWPGRWAEVRPPSRKELAATTVLALSLDEASAKVSDGPPDDPPEDVELPVWAGVAPLRTVYDALIPAPDLRPGLRAPLPPAPPGARAEPADE